MLLISCSLTNSERLFAVASGFDDSRYIDLKFNQFIGNVERSGYLVRADVARIQLEREKWTKTGLHEPDGGKRSGDLAGTPSPPGS